MIECDTDRPGGDIGMVYTKTLELCIAACDVNAACVDVSWIPANNGPCYMKGVAAGAVTTNGVWGAKFLTRGSQSSSSTSSSTTSAVTPIVVTTSSSTVSDVVTTTSSTTGVMPSSWSYQGCWVDNANGRALIQYNQNANTNTIESCIAQCAKLGYTIAGTEYADECYCDNYLRNGAELADSDDECNKPCAGDATEMCGAGNRLSVYSTISPPPVLPVPIVQMTNLPGSWKYSGCIVDSALDRTFTYQIINATANDVESCLLSCSKFGYGAGGMEYGQECYCGDVADTVGHAVQPDSECNVPCPGNPLFLCGGGDRISLYTWSGSSLAQWNYGTGPSAGVYEFLVGGLVIPLIATPAKNGKVTFLEKFGTGPDNSTGAYELDISMIGQGDAAWRTMHVKSDVFCAAGLTLPDIAARQISVGGWSANSLFGVRLYTPDGSPGTPGTNDWEENGSEISLQVGRWYPSAMIMPNGSILVVGGEDGSNGKAVPNLEILPRPAGGYVKHCDYLAETDPLNLYPFLAVLPSGNILISYYNQARILNANTLDTISVLPTIPGSVSRPDGGRTYPLEGAAVLLPQHAPYTEPLGVLICGGSTPYQGEALDNCVSIQPEIPDSQWTIERMPSRRVISCMAALPDGTYLIINGAQQGQAGFGLATDPNLNALLYDPSAPVHNRMTIMANTTVARLYHSEAVLLDDGRVMISGSDPKDNINPQEYRIEVFIPPYLLSGLPQPTFSIQNTDWAYNQQVTITLTSITSGPIRASLLGAVSSTHGNSMGQRTIFPDITCTGQTCVVTAPPNSGICPPGWFQLYMLDGPTPSHATWIRIGGDPASLGQWPANLPDFTPPGM